MIDWNALSLDELYRGLADTGLTRRLLELARDEDLGRVLAWPFGPAREGDVTSELCIDPGEQSSARLVAREEGVIAGLACIPEILAVFGTHVRFEASVRDGQAVQAGSILGKFDGRRRDILAIERTVLNLAGRLSGIATRTRAFVAEAKRMSPSVHVLDTRKTTPGLRVLEKYAVRCGGGHCHRFGLFDAILIKDNHLAQVSPERLGAFLTERSGRAGVSPGKVGASGQGVSFIEVEVDSLDQLKSLLRIRERLVNIVLLDNMSVSELSEAVALNQGAGSPVELEASGGVRMETIGQIAATGVHRISVGSLTHGARSLDVALDA